MKLLVLAALLTSVVATSAIAEPQEAKCFRTRDLRNHTVGDAHTLYFDVNGRSVYKVVTSNNCLATATSSDPIILLDRASSGQICSKMDLDISVGEGRCIVSSINKMTPEEIAALPRRVRP